MRLRVYCPAKVNLFLSVGPRDARGYHPIRTIFQAIGLYDELMIETAPETRITSDWPALPVQNTLSRTLSLMSELLQVPRLDIHLTKRIPTEAGLGGGSSDAAGLIRGLVELSGHSPPPEELHSVAASVGADVPFFLVGGRARGEGYGEELTPLPDPPVQWLIVAKPSVGCSTPHMYRQLDSLSFSWKEFDEPLHNDFERVAPCESLDLIERLLANGARDAALCGSGSAVFGRFHSREDADRARTALRVEGTEAVWMAPTLTRSESLRIERIDPNEGPRPNR